MYGYSILYNILHILYIYVIYYEYYIYIYIYTYFMDIAFIYLVVVRKVSYIMSKNCYIYYIYIDIQRHIHTYT